MCDIVVWAEVERVVISFASNHFLGEVKLTPASLKNRCRRVEIWAQSHHRPRFKASLWRWKRNPISCGRLPDWLSSHDGTFPISLLRQVIFCPQKNTSGNLPRKRRSSWLSWSPI